MNAEALDKVGDSRAAAPIAEASQALMAGADAIADPVRRRTFLERIEEIPAPSLLRGHS